MELTCTQVGKHGSGVWHIKLKENRAQHTDKFKEDEKQRSRLNILTKVWPGRGGVHVFKDLKKGACPMHRTERRSDGWNAQWQVGRDVQEHHPRPWEKEKYKLTRVDQWQITVQDPNEGATCYKTTSGVGARRLSPKSVACHQQRNFSHNVEVIGKWSAATFCIL